MPLESKYAAPADAASLETHAARVEAYEHICRAALAASGPVRAPAFALDSAQLDSLFTARQLDVLVVRPLKRPGPP